MYKKIKFFHNFSVIDLFGRMIWKIKNVKVFEIFYQKKKIVYD